VAAQVVSGIGFLGAGVILRDGFNIRGLTTAATLWCAAAVGSLAGAGMPWMALVGSLAIVATNVLLRPISRFVNKRAGLDRAPCAESDDEFRIEVVSSDKNESRVRALVLQSVPRPGFTLRALAVRTTKSAQTKVVAEVSAAPGGDTTPLELAVQRLGLDPKVTSSRWWAVGIDED
jgi:putative Mg2+ transporter-C (MgtC) family protein